MRDERIGPGARRAALVQAQAAAELFPHVGVPATECSQHPPAATKQTILGPRPSAILGRLAAAHEQPTDVRERSVPRLGRTPTHRRRSLCAGATAGAGAAAAERPSVLPSPSDEAAVRPGLAGCGDGAARRHGMDSQRWRAAGCGRRELRREARGLRAIAAGGASRRRTQSAALRRRGALSGGGGCHGHGEEGLQRFQHRRRVHGRPVRRFPKGLRLRQRPRAGLREGVRATSSWRAAGGPCGPARPCERRARADHGGSQAWRKHRLTPLAVVRG
mmetsp:Transcript_80720/g.234108  ORF Transcript_80720/g.234108 Transcript_80720/m.234108 type:complete len:275 (-) Transcript_80720:87-911(-)